MKGIIMRTELEAHPTVDYLKGQIKELNEELSEVVIDYESRLVEAKTLNKSLVKRIEELEGYFINIRALDARIYSDKYNPFEEERDCLCYPQMDVLDIVQKALKERDLKWIGNKRKDH